jgi:hypothetical protein
MGMKAKKNAARAPVIRLQSRLEMAYIRRREIREKPMGINRVAHSWTPKRKNEHAVRMPSRGG